MSCNTSLSLSTVVDAVNAQLNNNYVDRDDPRINQGVFTEPTIRGGLMLDEAAKLDFCGYVQSCGLQAPFGKQWVDRPVQPDHLLISYESAGEVKTRWTPSGGATTIRQELASDTGYRKVANQMAANAYGAPAKLYDVKYDMRYRFNILDFFGGYFWAILPTGKFGKSIDGEAWTELTAPVPSGSPVGLLPTSDGEVLFQTAGNLLKSTGWGSAATSWRVVVANPSTEAEAPFLRWGFDGKGDKFILTHYGAGGSNFAKSRYVWLSTDAGNTWDVVWDTDAQTEGDSGQSHLHAVCYDSWADRFYFSEGHGAIGGIYYSDDNGQNWSKMQNDRNLSPAFTVMVATDFGIVCGTDSGEHGIYVIRRAINPDEQGIELLARYPNPKGRDGVIGFADRGHRDPDTGIVYVGFMSNFDIITPMVFAVGSGGATVALEMPPSTSGFVSVRYYNVVAGNGKLLGRVLGHPTHAGSFTAKTSKYTTIPSALSSDYGNILPNDTINTLPSSLRIGINSTVNGQRSIAVGNMAVAGANAGSQDVIAIGHGASGGANGNTAIGMNAKCPAQYSIALGLETKTEGIESVAIGSRAIITTGSTLSVAVGYQAVVAGAYSTSVGAQASAKAFSSSFGFESLADSTNCLAAGWRSKALGINTVALGSTSSASGTSSAALGYASIATGDAATSFGANSKANTYSVSLGENSSALSVASVAVGKNSKADNASTVAVGYAANASGSYGVSVGNASKAEEGAISVGSTTVADYNAVALGSGASATQTSVSIGNGSKVTNAAGGCIAIGSTTNVTGAKAIAIGDNSSATHSNSVAIGSATASTKDNCLTVGVRDIESTKAGGKIYLKSPDGTSYAIGVGDDGVITAVAI